MENIKINIPDDVATEPSVNVANEVISVQFIDKTPCNWVIEETLVGILARNNRTGELFEGTIEEFNGKLK